MFLLLIKSNEKVVSYFITIMPGLHQWLRLAWQVLQYAVACTGLTISPSNLHMHLLALHSQSAGNTSLSQSLCHDSQCHAALSSFGQRYFSLPQSGVNGETGVEIKQLRVLDPNWTFSEIPHPHHGNTHVTSSQKMRWDGEECSEVQ